MDTAIEQFVTQRKSNETGYHRAFIATTWNGVAMIKAALEQYEPDVGEHSLHAALLAALSEK